MSLVNIWLALKGFPSTLSRNRNNRHSTSPTAQAWLRKASTSRMYLCVAMASVIGFISVVSLWASSKHSSPNPLPSRVVAQPFAPNLRSNQRGANPAPLSVTVETVTLTPQGFEPAEITPSAAKFVLGVNSRVLVEDLSFEILQKNGHKIHQLKMSKGQLRLRKLLNLPPGAYTLQVKDHPEWQCSIQVSN